MTYVDSSAMIAIYVTERFSKAARAAVRRASQIPYTPLHQLEVPNAFEMLVGRHAITRQECDAIVEQLQEDIRAHRLMTVSPDLEQVFARASELSRLYTAKTLARSLDLLHVAAAHLTSCTRFVSDDDRQLTVAKGTGLTVIDVKRGTNRRKQ